MSPFAAIATELNILAGRGISPGRICSGVTNCVLRLVSKSTDQTPKYASAIIKELDCVSKSKPSGRPLISGS